MKRAASYHAGEARHTPSKRKCRAFPLLDNEENRSNQRGSGPETSIFSTSLHPSRHRKYQHIPSNRSNCSEPETLSMPSHRKLVKEKNAKQWTQRPSEQYWHSTVDGPTASGIAMKMAMSVEEKVSKSTVPSPAGGVTTPRTERRSCQQRPASTRNSRRNTQRNRHVVYTGHKERDDDLERKHLCVHACACDALVCSATLRCAPRTVLTFISFHFISFHFISFHFISFHFISFHFISFHFISFHFISFHFISFHFISFHFISFHFISFHFISFHFISFFKCLTHASTARARTVRHESQHTHDCSRLLFKRALCTLRSPAPRAVRFFARCACSVTFAVARLSAYTFFCVL